jgi:putative transposase
MYARGMSTREIAEHLREIYGMDASADLISTITDAVLDEVAAWQQRPLDPVYPLVFFDAIRVKIATRAWSATRPSTSRWASWPMAQGGVGDVDRAERRGQILAAGHERTEEPRRRGYPAGRGRWAQGIPRGDQRRVSRHHRSDVYCPFAQEFHGFRVLQGPQIHRHKLKEIYRAVNADAAEALAAFEAGPWGQKYPAIGQSWRAHGSKLFHFLHFLVMFAGSSTPRTP